jgi:proteasome lid subunit RPN8/RPN11
VKIAARVLAAVEAHARQAAPHECCGLLVGTPEDITLAIPANNRAAESERRYLIDPQDHFAAIRHARAIGFEVVGAYHSHPRSQPIPSETDRAEAFEDFVFLIVGRSDRLRQGSGGPEDRPNDPPSADARYTMRAWRLSSGNFTELAFVSVA